MLNISKLNAKNSNIQNIYKKEEGNLKEKNNYNPSVNREWSDNIYTYNQNSIKLLPIKHGIVFKLIKSYFNMSIYKLDDDIRAVKKSRKRNRPLWRILNSSKRIFISTPSIKHTNSEVNITLFVYNRQKNIIINKLFRIKSVLNNLLFKIQNNEDIKYIFNNKFLIFKSRLSFLKNHYINSNSIINKLIEIKEIKRIIFKLKRIMLLKKVLFFNEFKFKSTYLLPLIKLLEKVYNKKVILNIINLKNYYLNSEILNQILAYKLNKRKQRGKATKFLRSAMRNINTSKLNHNILTKNSNKNINIQNILIRKNLNNITKDKLNSVLKRNYIINNNSNTYLKDIQNDVLNSTKYKSISGIRLEIAGRITRRITAQRAGYKYRYLGTLKNFDSSYKGLSSRVLRGNLGSNVQYTNLKSKTIIGSFGLKGWISSV